MWSDAPVDEAVKRYEQGERHGIHEDDPHDTDLSKRAGPLELGPVIRVDTSSSADEADPAQFWDRARTALG